MTTAIIHSVPPDLDTELRAHLIPDVSTVVENWSFDQPMHPGAIHLTTERYKPSRHGGTVMLDTSTNKATNINCISFADLLDNFARSLVTSDHFVAAFLNHLADRVHADNVKAGWWSDLRTGHSILHSRNVPEMLCLVHSEISEAMEGHRKTLKDDKLPHRPMLQTELVDALIRIFDLLGSRAAIDRDLKCSPDMAGDIFVEKRAYNAKRADHKPENRMKDGGKAF